MSHFATFAFPLASLALSGDGKTDAHPFFLPTEARRGGPRSWPPRTCKARRGRSRGWPTPLRCACESFSLIGLTLHEKAQFKTISLCSSAGKKGRGQDELVKSGDRSIGDFVPADRFPVACQCGRDKLDSTKSCSTHFGQRFRPEEVDVISRLHVGDRFDEPLAICFVLDPGED